MTTTTPPTEDGSNINLLAGERIERSHHFFRCCHPQQRRLQRTLWCKTLMFLLWGTLCIAVGVFSAHINIRLPSKWNRTRRHATKTTDDDDVDLFIALFELVLWVLPMTGLAAALLVKRWVMIIFHPKHGGQPVTLVDIQLDHSHTRTVRRNRNRQAQDVVLYHITGHYQMTPSNDDCNEGPVYSYYYLGTKEDFEKTTVWVNSNYPHFYFTAEVENTPNNNYWRDQLLGDILIGGIMMGTAGNAIRVFLRQMKIARAQYFSFSIPVAILAVGSVLLGYLLGFTCYRNQPMQLNSPLDMNHLLRILFSLEIPLDELARLEHHRHR